MAISLGIPDDLLTQALILQAGARERVHVDTTDLDIPPVPDMRVARVTKVMTAEELQAFKGRCTIRIGDETGELSDLTRARLVATAGGVAQVSDKTTWLGRIFGR